MVAYFVSTSGNDSNSGTQGSPFRNINKGLSVMAGGDTLFLRQGTYFEQIDANTRNIPGGSSWANATIISSFPSEIATITIAVPYINNAVLNLAINMQPPYVIFDRLKIDGSNSRYILSVTTDHIRFQNGEMANSGLNFPFHTPFDPGQDETQAVQLGGFFNEVINTEIHHSPHSYGFYVTGHDNLVNNNIIHDNGGFAVQIFEGNFPSSTAHNHIVSNNIMYGNGFFRNYPAITVGEGADNLIYNNVIYNNFGGIWVYKNGTRTTVVNNTLYNNTVLGIQIYDPNDNAIVRNNIIIGSNGPPVDNSGTSSVITPNISTAQNFANPSIGDFHLLTGSSAIDSGVILPVPTVDKDGITRPQGVTYDIGAYEFFISAPTSITCDDTLPFTLVTSGVFANNNLLKTVSFSIRPARWICFRGISEVNGNPWLSCCELSVLVNGVSLLPKSLWNIWCFDSQDPSSPAINCIDNNTNTFWHTLFSGSNPVYPHNIIIDLGTAYPINGFTYLPRQDGNSNGTAAGYEFYVADYWVMPGRLMKLSMMQPLLAM